MWRNVKPTIIVYFFFLCLLILITPPYGDPAVVLWTSKVMARTGFPYDPVASIHISKVGLQLCVRSPLYYSLLAISNEYYKIVLIVLVGIYFILQNKLAHSIGISLNVYSLMFPPIYLLFSRTYVDSLTAILSATLLLALIRVEGKNNQHYVALLFLTPLLLMLTRESAMVLPLLLLIILLITRDLRDRKLLIVFLGWIAGFFIYSVYISLSGGVPYSDFQPHIPSLLEVYGAVMRVLTPILPWEVKPEDLQAYLHLSAYVDWLTLIVVVAIHVLAAIVFIPVALSLTRVRGLHKVIVGWLIFGFFASAGLLFLKGAIDFFRHLSYLLPIIPLLIERGYEGVGEYSRVGARFIKIALILLFGLYFVRTVRLYASGYAFDACEYLLKRPVISSVDFFRETACSMKG